jgi:hypothetical protein
MDNSTIKNIKAIIFGLISVIGINFAVAAWSDPQCTPPNCNLDAPLNASSLSQARTGPLMLGDSNLPNSGFNFSAKGGPAFLEGVITNQLTFADSNTSRANKVLTSNSKGVASWSSQSSSMATSSFITNPFSVNVLRNTSQTISIPSTYQYCAISQMGPDFANSDNGDTTASVCSVNRNGNGTWTLYGKRLDDPDFICKAQCFYSTAISVVIEN